MILNKINNNTYYIDNNTNIGIYKINDKDVYLIDSPIDKDSAKKIDNILIDNNLNPIGIINTHHHADHIGGNNYFQNKYNLNIYCSDIEKVLIENTILESVSVYSTNPIKEIKNKFLYSSSSKVSDIDNIKDIFKVINLKGHSINNIGIVTNDDVIFLGDSLIDENTINKYNIFYIYDINEYLNTLNILENMNYKYYVISHGYILKDINELININRNKIYEIINTILNLLEKDLIFEDIIKNIFDIYNLKMNILQHTLISATIKGYLVYLININKVEYYFKDNYLYYKKVRESV